MNSVIKSLKTSTIRVLRWSERYTRTDMVYLAQAGFWNNLNVIVSSVLALLLSVAFANLLPKEVYGTYQYLLSLSALLAAACLGGGMMHAVAQSSARGYEGDMRAALRVQLMWGLVPMGAGLLGAGYYAFAGNNTIALGLVVIALLTPLINAFGIYAALLGGLRQFKRAFTYGLIGNIAYYSTIFLTLTFFKNALLLVFVNLAVNVMVGAFLYYRTLKICKPNNRTDPETIPYGAHLSVMGGVVNIISQLDSILVFHFLGPLNLAVYSFATFIPERAGALLSFIGTAAFPKYSQRSLKEVQRSIIPQTIRAALFASVAVLLYILLAPVLFHVLFPKYLDALPYTQWYAPVMLLMVANLVSLALTAQRLKVQLYISSFVNPLLLITLQIPLLLLYGIWGMLIARIVTDLIGILLGILLLLRARS